MNVDMGQLLAECERWGARPHWHESSVMAHALLSKLPADPRVQLQWAQAKEWQLSIAGVVVHTGSFEDCVSELAARSSP